jgi:hypothetical protein
MSDETLADTAQKILSFFLNCLKNLGIVAKLQFHFLKNEIYSVLGLESPHCKVADPFRE